jgi:hypothetical protein
MMSCPDVLLLQSLTLLWVLLLLLPLFLVMRLLTERLGLSQSPSLQDMIDALASWFDETLNLTDCCDAVQRQAVHIWNMAVLQETWTGMVDSTMLTLLQLDLEAAVGSVDTDGSFVKELTSFPHGRLLVRECKQILVDVKHVTSILNEFADAGHRADAVSLILASQGGCPVAGSHRLFFDIQLPVQAGITEFRNTSGKSCICRWASCWLARAGAAASAPQV